jgi:hypothetical protein
VVVVVVVLVVVVVEVVVVNALSSNGRTKIFLLATIHDGVPCGNIPTTIL